MTKGTTKKALIMSVLSMLVCCAMLIGSTFAWFSDEATAGKSKIVAGNLDVELLDENDEKLTDTIFDEDILWEPGVMEVSKEFKVANQGNLALWYDLSLKVVEENLVNGRSLSDVIAVKVVAAENAPALAEDSTLADRVEAWEALDDTTVAAQGTLEPQETSDALVVVLFWAPNDNAVDNLYNLNNGTYTEETAPSITFALSVYATQTPSESDSFGKDYDTTAKATRSIYAAVAAGVGKMNNLMANSENGNYAQLSELVESEANVYTSTVTMYANDAENVTVAQVYTDIGETLFGEVNKQAEHILKIKVVTDLGEAEIETNGEEIADRTFVDLIAESLNGSAGEVARMPITELDGYSIKVIISDTDGVDTTYVLSFVKVPSMATNAIHNTVVAGVDKMNDLMDYAQMSALEGSDGAYTTNVVVSNGETTVAQVYVDIGETLFNEVVSQAANIKSITISATGGEAVTTEDITVDGLVNAAYACVANAGVTARTPLSALNGSAITVTIVDINDIATSYTLNFVLA